MRACGSWAPQVVIIVKPTEAPSGCSVDTDNDDDDDPATEEAVLLAAVDKATRFSVLADAMLDLHHWPNRCWAPLRPRSTCSAALPGTRTSSRPSRPRSSLRPLTLADLYGDNPVPPGADAGQAFVMDMADFRRDVAVQVPEMQVKRSLDRAKAVLEAEAYWEGRATFAGEEEDGCRGGGGGSGGGVSGEEGEVVLCCFS